MSETSCQSAHRGIGEAYSSVTNRNLFADIVRRDHDRVTTRILHLPRELPLVSMVRIAHHRLVLNSMVRKFLR